jgi:Arc/MetJ-type ribon-helix-helix transcriptional regulator
MIRTQIQITPKQARALKRIAAREGRSMAEVIRISLDALIRSEGLKDQEELRKKAAACAGKLSAPENMAENHDEYLAEAYEK